MRTLKLEKYGKIYIDGQEADTSLLTDKAEFVKGIMLLDVELGEDVNVGDVVHFFYEARDLIQSFFSEEYEVVRALVTSSRLPKPYKRLEVFKKLRIEPDSIDEDSGEFLHLNPEISFIESESGEDGLINIGTLPLVIVEDVIMERDGVKIVESKTKLTMLDLMVCLFEELPAILKEGFILSS